MGQVQAATYPALRRRCQFSSLSTIQVQRADQCFVDVAGQSAEEDGRVQHDDDPLERRRKDVVVQLVDVVLVADAVIVAAVARRRRPLRRHLHLCTRTTNDRRQTDRVSTPMHAGLHRCR